MRYRLALLAAIPGGSSGRGAWRRILRTRPLGRPLGVLALLAALRGGSSGRGAWRTSMSTRPLGRPLGVLALLAALRGGSSGRGGHPDIRVGPPAATVHWTVAALRRWPALSARRRSLCTDVRGTRPVEGSGVGGQVNETGGRVHVTGRVI